MTLNCRKAPAATARGAESTRVKSASVSVMPMQSRMSCTSGAMTCFISKPPGAMNHAGKVKAAAPKASTVKVKPSPRSHSRRRDATARAAKRTVRVRPVVMGGGTRAAGSWSEAKAIVEEWNTRSG